MVGKYAVTFQNHSHTSFSPIDKFRIFVENLKIPSLNKKKKKTCKISYVKKKKKKRDLYGVYRTHETTIQQNETPRIFCLFSLTLESNVGKRKCYLRSSFDIFMNSHVHVHYLPYCGMHSSYICAGSTSVPSLVGGVPPSGIT